MADSSNPRTQHSKTKTGQEPVFVLLRTLDDIRTIVLEGWHSYEMETAIQMFRKEGVFAGMK
jgi:hypothetical protein